MKLLFIILFSFSSLAAYSQGRSFEKPNYKKIEKNIKNQDTNLHYTSLMNRYLKADSTFTLEEKRHLYYGYSFNDKYAPYSISDFSDSLVAILRKEKHSKLELNKIVQLGDSILIENPFDLRVINYQLYALDEMGDKKNFEIKLIQLNTIIDALMSSGNGTSKEDAFYVIYTTHEYDLLNIIGFQY